jgi:hypothetical protein
MPLDEVIFLLRGRLVLAPCVPFIEHEFSVIDEFLGVVEGSPVEFHGHDPDSSSHSGSNFGCALLPHVRGGHDALRSRRIQPNAAPAGFGSSALAQGSMGALADAGRIDASQLSQTFSSLPDKGSWFDRAPDP